MSERKKNYKDWFDQEAARLWSAQLKSTGYDFDSRSFCRRATQGLESLEFKARVEQFAVALKETLPPDPAEALRILGQSLPEPLPDCNSPTDGWLQWPMGEFIARYGLENFDQSMELMTALTQRFTSEFAVRPFVKLYPKETRDRLLALCDHPNPHVRRWCSEGVRTRLPWGEKLTGLIEEPEMVLPILRALKGDQEPYVWRSVANNFNDLSKDHPGLVERELGSWTDESTRFMKHALRGLIKGASPGALALLGFESPKDLSLNLSLNRSEVRIGDSLEMTLELSTQSTKPQKLQIDYLVHYRRQKSKSNAKVFKWKSLELESKGEVQLVKQHSFRETTVRRLYAGEHALELQINGQLYAKTDFQLIPPKV